MFTHSHMISSIANIINFSEYQSFVCTQLIDFKYWHVTLQNYLSNFYFVIQIVWTNCLNSSIWLIDRIISDTNNIYNNYNDIYNIYNIYNNIYDNIIIIL